VIRTFEFVSALRRMSVVVKRLKSTSMEVYVKGAPEVMADICEKDSCASPCPRPPRCTAEPVQSHRTTTTCSRTTRGAGTA
jgi:magnesium-transporting ATPase (P-type)